MDFDWALSIGHLLTSFSILFGVVTFIVTWGKGRRERFKLEADKIRKAASSLISKLERRYELSRGFFIQVEVTFIEASRLMTDHNAGYVTARDFLWEKISQLYAAHLQKVIDEKIEIAYVDLHGYSVSIRAHYQQKIAALRKIDQDANYLLLEKTQEALWECYQLQQAGTLSSAQVGNALRTALWKVQDQLGKALHEEITAFRGPMVQLINAGDKAIYSKEAILGNPFLESDPPDAAPALPGTSALGLPENASSSPGFPPSQDPDIDHRDPGPFTHRDARR